MRIRDLMPLSALEPLRATCAGLFAARAGWSEGDFFDFAAAEHAGVAYTTPQLINLSRYAPQVLESPVVQIGLQVARQILGQEARLNFDHAFLKPPHSTASTPWHQDEAFWEEGFHHDGFSLWIPLQDVDEANGCLRFVPGSHRRGLREHRPIDGDPRVHGLEVAGLDPANAVSAPLKLGDVTIHHARTLHASPPNTSDSERLAYVLVFLGHVRRLILNRARSWSRGGEAAASAGS